MKNHDSTDRTVQDQSLKRRAWPEGDKRTVVVLSLLLFTTMFFFFYRIAFLGDYPGHYTFAVDLGLLRDMGIRDFIAQEKDYHILSYPVWHLVFLLLLTFLNFVLDLAAAVLPVTVGQYGRYALVIGVENALILTATFWLMYGFFKRFMKGEDRNGYAFLFAAVLLFAGPGYLPAVNRTYDLGQLLLTPWYNPTTIAVKPLAVLCLWLYMELLENRREGVGQARENRLFLLLGITLFVSGLVKPSFFQIFVPALFLYCVIDVAATRLKSFWFCFKTGLAVLPVCALALLQLWISFYSQEGKGVKFGFLYGWGYFTEHVFWSMLISAAFPAAVYILFFRQVRREKPLLLGLLCFLSGVLQYAVLYEENNVHCGNFSWGASLGVYLFFLTAAVCYQHRISEKENRAVAAAAGALLGWQFICGLIYFVRLCTAGVLWTSLL